jgi:hypothetical protein
MLDILTFAEVDLMDDYRRKWHQLMVSSTPIQRDRATLVIKEVYKLCGLSSPEVIFCSSPYAVALVLTSLSDKEFPLHGILGNQFKLPLDLSTDIFPLLLSGDGWDQQDYLTYGWGVTESLIWSKLINKMACKIGGGIPKSIRQQLDGKLKGPLREFWGKKFPLREKIAKTVGQFICYHNLSIHQHYPEIRNDLQTKNWELWGAFWLSSYFNDWLISAAWLDYCINVLGYGNSFRDQWLLLKSLITDCGWLYLGDRFSIVCNYPTYIGHDRLKFTDGFVVNL